MKIQRGNRAVGELSARHRTLVGRFAAESGGRGQMLGSAAVFITLVYLAIQTNHSRREMRRSISLARASGVRDVVMSVATNEPLTVICGQS